MVKNKCYFQSIDLTPTPFHLHFWVCSDVSKLAKYFKKKYGNTVDYYKSELTPNQIQIVDSTKESTSKGETIIVVNVQELDLNTVVHELAHAMFYINKCSHVEISGNSQQWVAFMLEYLFDKCKSIKNFTEQR